MFKTFCAVAQYFQTFKAYCYRSCIDGIELIVMIMRINSNQNLSSYLTQVLAFIKHNQHYTSKTKLQKF